ncbi:ATP-binding protein [Variovorax sp. PAMC 28711]|uniref:ATP-binding protein n=1 Tax=Variovorax sp. PAMC 28711 TaxID=1795631 RepID=UPI0009EC3892|nr:adenylate/guanylate cyclase domain-containing protein [Variovorax sp. PAMC 28711]
MNACANCGTPREASHRFCWQCGALLDAQRELKQVTVLLADLCDSTAQVVQTGAEAGQAYLDTAYRLMSEAVEAYGGTRMQWRGDELLALFGAPLAQEDHALRACLAASAMLEAMQAHTTAESPMRVRIGIDSGEVIAGPGGADMSTPYRVDGPPIHLASRLEQLASPGTAHVSGNTMQLVGDQIETRLLGKRELRGFSAPVDVHEITVGQQGSAAAPLARRRYLGPLVGRTEAIDDLKAIAERVRAGAFCAVGLRGEAGIGKSRLIAELSTHLRANGFAVAPVTARGYASHVPYGLVADLARVLLGLGGDPSAEPANLHSAALTDLLDAGDAGDAWRALSPLQRSERIANTFAWLVRERTRSAPLVLAIDDVFLADRGSLRLLEMLARRLQSQPLLVLMSYRQDYVHRWSDAPWFAEHWIGPLPSERMVELAQALLGGDESLHAVRTALLDRADGNPFFLEQMVMTLVDGGSLLGLPGGYRATSGASPLGVPASIMAVIGARVDRLPADTKASLEAAAIVGEPLLSGVVAAMRNIDEAEAESHLRQAMSGGLITASAGAGASGAYAFRHGLVQEAVAATLTRARRSQLHRAAFDALRLRGGDPPSENPAVLAHHAYNGEQWLSAAEYAQRAMTRSIARSDNRDALRVFSLGLEAARRVEPEAAMLTCELALRMEALGAQMAVGLFDAIVTNLERAERITRTLGDTRRQAAVALQLAVVLWTRGSYRQGLEAAANAGAVALAAGSRSLQMAAMQARMMLNHGLGRYAVAGADAAEVEREFAVELRGRRLMAGWAVIASINVKTFLADTLIWKGEFVAAQAACDAAYRELAAEDHAFSRVLVDFVQAELMLAQHRAGDAVTLLRSALELCRVHELSNMQPAIVAYLGGAMARSGQALQALALLEPAIAAKISLSGGRYNEFYFPFNLAIALQTAGRAEEAIVAARTACEAASALEQRGHEARALQLLAGIEGEAGRAHDAALHTQQAQAAAHDCGMARLHG